MGEIVRSSTLGSYGEDRSSRLFIVCAISFVSYVLIGLGVGLHAQPILPAEPDPAPINQIEQLGVVTPLGTLDAFWHLRMTGADWAKNELNTRPHHAANVVVVDAGVTRGADTIMATLPRSPRRVMLRLFDSVRAPETPPQPESPEPGATKGILDQFFDYFRSQEIEILDPREFVYPEASEHGNHVAGIIGASNPQFGVSSSAYVHSLNIDAWPTYTRLEDFAREMESLPQRLPESSIINMSLMLPAVSGLKEAMIALSQSPDHLLVMATGNDASRVHPGQVIFHLREAVAVGAISPSGTRTFFSNYGAQMDLVAPGYSILSRGEGIEVEGEELEFMSGTSMATPMVTGAAANIRSVLPSASPELIKEILYRTAWDLNRPGKDEETGYGLLNVLKSTVAAMQFYERFGENSEMLLQEAKKPENYQFDDRAFNAALERTEACFSCPVRMELLYRFVHLSSDPQNLKLLASDRVNAHSNLSFGYKYMANNRPSAKLSEEETQKFAQEIVAAQMRHRRLHERDWSVFENLSNADLILAVAKATKEEKSFAKLFRRRMLFVDPSKLSDLERVLKDDTSTDTPANPGPSAPSSTEPLPSPEPTNPQVSQNLLGLSNIRLTTY